MNLWQRYRPVLVAVGLYGVLLLAWYSIAELELVPQVFVPSPRAVVQAFRDIAFGSGYKGQSLWGHLMVSLGRIGLAFALAGMTAVPLAFLCHASKIAQAVMTPIIHFSRQLPPLAYYTLLIIWLGIGDASKVTLLYLAGFAPVFISCLSAAENVDPNRIITARTLGATPLQVFWHVVLPSSMPGLFAGLRTSMGFIYTTLVAAEMVAARSGVGWMVLDAGKFLRSNVIFVGIIVIGVTGVLIDAVILWLERLLVPWEGKGE